MQDKHKDPDPDDKKVAQDKYEGPDSEGLKEGNIIFAEVNNMQSKSQGPDPDGGGKENILLEGLDIKEEGYKGPDPEKGKEVKIPPNEDWLSKNYRPLEIIGGKVVKRQRKPPQKHNITILGKITMPKQPP